MELSKFNIVRPRTLRPSQRPRGIITMYRDDERLWQVENLIVNTGLVSMAESLAGVAAYAAAAIGFGNGNTTPTVTDTDLSGTQKYYNAIGSATYPSSGTVQFAFTLATTDYAANGLILQELGMFSNNATTKLPSETGFTISARANSTGYTVGQLYTAVTSTVTYVYRCTTAGTSAGSQPSMGTTIGGNTTDGTAVFTCIALVTDFGASNNMIAHAVVPSFTYNGSGSYTGTWSITF